MLDEYIENQKINYKILKNAIDINKYSHAYIFESNGNDYTLNFAKAFAKSLLCPNKYSNNLKCNNCSQCKRIDNNDFTDIKVLEPDGLWIKKEQLIDLKNEFKVKSLEADKKVYIINDASKLNESSSNSLLKFIEEPEENIIAILIVDNVYQLLPTIRSRCQVISLRKNDNINDIKYFLSHNSSDINYEEIINDAVKFINYLENNKLNTLLNTKKLVHNKFDNKDKMILLFEIIILYYQDVINIILDRKCKFFKDYISSDIILKNNLQSLCKKIKIALSLKEKIFINVNNYLLVDKLIMEIGEVK